MSRAQIIRKLVAQGIDVDAILAGVLQQPPQAWECKGVSFPNGTFFRTWHIDRPYWGQVVDGQLVVNGHAYATPSAAAAAIFHRPTNGWDIWECRMPHSTKWHRIDALRRATHH